MKAEIDKSVHIYEEPPVLMLLGVEERWKDEDFIALLTQLKEEWNDD